MKKGGNRREKTDCKENYGYLQIIDDSSGDFETDFGVDVKLSGTTKSLHCNNISDKDKSESAFSCRGRNWRKNLKDSVRLRSQHSINDKNDSVEAGYSSGKEPLLIGSHTTSGQPRSNNSRENSGSGFNYMNCFKSDDQDKTDNEDEFGDDLGDYSNTDQDQISSIYSQPLSLQDWSNASETFSYRKFRTFDPVTINKEIWRLDVEKLGYVFVDDVDVPDIIEANLTSQQIPNRRRVCVIL